MTNDTIILAGWTDKMQSTTEFPAEALIESADALVELLRTGDEVTSAVRDEIWITLYRFAENARGTAPSKG